MKSWYFHDNQTKNVLLGGGWESGVKGPNFMEKGSYTQSARKWAKFFIFDLILLIDFASIILWILGCRGGAAAGRRAAAFDKSNTSQLKCEFRSKTMILQCVFKGGIEFDRLNTAT